MNCYLGLKNRLQVYLGVKLFLSRESLAVDGAYIGQKFSMCQKLRKVEYLHC